MYPFILSVHILAATLWTGGHLILALGFLPEALRNRDAGLIQQFEQRYERIGLPAMGIQVLSGLWLAHVQQPDWRQWFGFLDSTAALISLKLGLLALTVVLALHARLRLIPNLGPASLPALALHIGAVTLLSVLFVLAGVGFRLRGFF